MNTKGSGMEKDFTKLNNLTGRKLHHYIAEKISSQHILIYCAQEFYEYIGGVYIHRYEPEINQWIMELAKDKQTRQVLNEVSTTLKNRHFIRPEKLNYSNLLNLKNGMIDLNNLDFETLKIIEHAPKYLSTIRLNVEFDEKASCLNWLKFLKEIFPEDVEGYKMKILQEFFGLCLTKDTEFEKCLWMIGKGANGKSVIAAILQVLVGEENSTSIAMESLVESHYQADLFGKLVNVCSEPKSKSKVCDELLKRIISGDSLQAAGKFKKSLKFTPFCKVVICANNHPRVDDRTEGYWRKLLILDFKRQFSEKEQDKGLKKKLIKELDGIFLWALYGLRNLKKRKYFDINEEMNESIDKIKYENNNVRVFVDECCVINGISHMKKRDLFNKYVDWAKDSNAKPFGIINFGQELLKAAKGKVTENLSSGHWWEGVRYEDYR